MDNEQSTGNGKKIGLVALVLMAFSSIYGLGNTTLAYEQMAYAAILWYVFAAIFFFLPSALMFAEYGSTFKEAHGGIYSWLAASIGDRPAFIGTFIWLSGWIIWLVSTSSRLWITFSVIISGHDTTGTWSLFGLNSTQTIGILGILLMLGVTYFSAHGFSKIAQYTSFSGILVFIIMGLFMLLSVILIFLNHGHLAQPLTAQSLVKSPNPAFESPTAVFSFIVYAIFAYGGMETMGGVIDNVKKPEKTFPRAMIVTAIIMTFFYAVSIGLWGVSANWRSVMGVKTTNQGNVTYVLMNNLGMEFGKALGLSTGGVTTMGNWFARVNAIQQFITMLGAMFVLVYSPLKSFILGSPKKFWPKKMTQLNKYNVPGYAMWVQAVIVIVILFFVAFGGSGATAFYAVLTDMSNMSSAVPYLFLIGAYPFFRAKKNLEHPFIAFRKKSTVWAVTIVSWLLVLFGIIFTAIEPVLEGDMYTAFWTIAGPVVFALIAVVFYNMSERKISNK
ncbi:amino acid transporter [Lactobacillus selangorensis]|uniref:Amino acid transporter n=1 Tax=Lactobacillus selangorensis TaxID=81857 RepID=A0A0R2FGD2_9LACO|nr:glutamate/gamma-aminobutyrate family transporter YjeM [Lactobacillus selangorensis]KRN27679.1 amino acid transporter [Lactobacillus selangorensis]KRN30354.1 amino acid transporter [Lactobacillus selangorensis]